MRSLVGRLGRLTEPVPENEPVVRDMPVRHHEVLPLQHRVERLHTGHKAFAVRRRDDQFDQFIEDGVLDAGQVAACLARGGFGAPIAALFVARGGGLPPPRDHHIEIEIVEPLLVLRRLDRAHPHFDSQSLEVPDIGQHDTFEQRADEKDFKRHRFAGRSVGELLGLGVDRPSRLFEKR